MLNKAPEEKLLDLIKRAQGRMRLKRELKIFMKVSAILGGLIVLVLVFFLVDVYTSKHGPSKLSADLKEQREGLLLNPKENDRTTQGIEAIAEKEGPIPKVGNLVLLGIVRGDIEQAIIEDKETERTIFLYPGDSIGGFTVSNIKERSVILDYKGEKIELNI